jgi:LPXTG-site transpeptidase (sortase) family protein
MNFNLKSLKIFLTAGFILIGLGSAGSIPTIYYHFSNKGSVDNTTVPTASAQPPAKTETILVEGHPQTISVPSLGINLPIIDGYYNKQNGQWTLSLDKAQFATPSQSPNNHSGNTLIYGHYRKGVFATLHNITTGAEVDIYTSNGYIFAYKYTGSYAVTPDNTSIFDYQGPPMLTIQTCSGAWFQNRQLYQFSYIGYKKL